MTTETESPTIASFAVVGRPRTKGSMKVITPRGRKPIMVEDHKDSAPWRLAVKRAAWQAYPDFRKPWHQPEHGPVLVALVFRYERPATGVGLSLPWPVINAGVNASGDLDKSVRLIFDALQDAKVFQNDCQVVGLAATKRWCEAGQSAGVEIEVSRA